MDGFLRKNALKHVCALPVVYGRREYVGAVWRCRECSRLGICRQGWYFGEMPPWFWRTVSDWHKARWWERLKWAGKKPRL